MKSSIKLEITKLSIVQNPGWLFDIGDYTTQFYGDYDKPIRIPVNQSGFERYSADNDPGKFTEKNKPISYNDQLGWHMIQK